MTVQRRVILDALARRSWHPTGDEVYRVVRRRLPRISLGTVYRNLDLLSRAGMIRPLDLAERRRRFDGSLEPHYHVRCLSCGRVDDVPAGLVPDMAPTRAAARGYRVTGYHVELVGHCPHCQRREPRTRQVSTHTARTARAPRRVAGGE